MKRWMLGLLFISIGFLVHAQNWDEWFRQKETQIKYLSEQVAALKMYGSAVEKGYQIVQGGLDRIGDIKNGDFSRHDEHFTSLRKVNNEIKNGGSMKDVSLLRRSIINLSEKNRQFVRQCGQYAGDEVDYFIKVFDGVVLKAKMVSAEAEALSTDGQIQMSDDERLRRLQSLQRSMKDLFLFSSSFDREIAAMAILRELSKKEAKRLRTLN